MNGRNVAASVRAKLLKKARADKREFTLVLTRYALERLLYRLSISKHADHFLLKGALLFDLWVLARHSDFEGEVLREAIGATLTRRGTDIPTDVPFGLTDAFATDAQKQMQWQGFLKKNRLEALMLEQVVAELRKFLMPPLSALVSGEEFGGSWNRESWAIK